MSNLRPQFCDLFYYPYFSGYSRILSLSLFSIFLLTFFSSTYWNRWRFFFHAVADNPSRGLLTRIGDRSPFGAITWEKRRTRVPLVFHVEAAARALSPMRGTFSTNRSENFAVSDVCNWQIILMVILDETCHRQPHKFHSVVDARYMMLSYWYKPNTLRSIHPMSSF